MITHEIFNLIQKGDIIQTTMRAREVISFSNGMVRLKKVYQKGDSEETCYTYTDLKHCICSITRPLENCKVRIVFNRQNEEAQAIIDKANTQCSVCKTFGEELYECKKCSSLFCDKCQTPYNQFTQIDYNCCKNCVE